MRNLTAIAAVSAALILAGCSSSTTGTATTTTESDSGTFRVGMECNYAPFNWTTTTEGEYTQPLSTSDYCDGYDVVIASTIAKTLGKDVQIVKTDWDALIVDLQQGSLDAIIAGMTETPERAEQVSFTSPYYVSPEVVIVRNDSDLTGITDIQELSGRKVQGQIRSSMISMVLCMSKQRPISLPRSMLSSMVMSMRSHPSFRLRSVSVQQIRILPMYSSNRVMALPVPVMKAA